MSIIVDGKEYKTFDDVIAEWNREEQLWPWYKKAYYAWLRSNFWPSKIWYWFRCHTYTRYHILDMRNRFYNWGWCDRCDLVLYAPFQLLCDFIEREKPPKGDDDPNNEHWDHAYKEMWALYNWWTEERKDHSNFDKELEDKDQEMLMRLVKVRQFMWT